MQWSLSIKSTLSSRVLTRHDKTASKLRHRHSECRNAASQWHVADRCARVQAAADGCQPKAQTSGHEGHKARSCQCSSSVQRVLWRADNLCFSACHDGPRALGCRSKRASLQPSARQESVLSSPLPLHCLLPALPEEQHLSESLLEARSGSLMVGCKDCAGGSWKTRRGSWRWRRRC